MDRDVRTMIDMIKRGEIKSSSKGRASVIDRARAVAELRRSKPSRATAGMSHIEAYAVGVRLGRKKR